MRLLAVVPLETSHRILEPRIPSAGPQVHDNTRCSLRKMKRVLSLSDSGEELVLEGGGRGVVREFEVVDTGHHAGEVGVRETVH